MDPGELRPRLATKYENRLERLNARIAAAPNDAKAYADRAALYYGNGEAAKAIADFEQSLQKNPDQPGVSNDLAWTYVNCAE